VTPTSEAEKPAMPWGQTKRSFAKGGLSWAMLPELLNANPAGLEFKPGTRLRLESPGKQNSAFRCAGPENIFFSRHPEQVGEESCFLFKAKDSYGTSQGRAGRFSASSKSLSVPERGGLGPAFFALPFPRGIKRKKKADEKIIVAGLIGASAQSKKKGMAAGLGGQSQGAFRAADAKIFFPYPWPTQKNPFSTRLKEWETDRRAPQTPTYGP